MTEEKKRPLLGLHEVTTILTKSIEIRIPPGTGRCPGCRCELTVEPVTDEPPTDMTNRCRCGIRLEIHPKGSIS